MATPALNEEIVTSYEQLGMTPEQIAEDQSLDVAAIKAILIGQSATYRKTVSGGEAEELFNKHDMKAATEVMRNCMLAEDGHLAFRAARFVIDEVKGRNDARVSIPIDQTFDALELNRRLLAARQALQKGREQKVLQRPEAQRQLSQSMSVKIIDVEPIPAT
jgi:hypothetical protein